MIIISIKHFRCDVGVLGKQWEDWDKVIRQATVGSNDVMHTVISIDRMLSLLYLSLLYLFKYFVILYVFTFMYSDHIVDENKSVVNKQ